MIQRPLVKSILLFIFYISLPLPGYSGESDTIHMKDFGLIPDSRKNAVKLVQLALDSCRNLKDPVLVFKKGRYDFWPQYAIEKTYFESNTTANNPKRCAILLNEFNGLTIDANGSDFIFHDRIQPFTIDHSDNVSIKNVQIDWEIPLTGQAIVTDTNSAYIDISIDSVQHPFFIERGKLVFVGEGWKSAVWGMMEFEPASGMIVPQTGDAGVLGSGWESYTAIDKGRGIVRMQYPFKRKPAIGNVLVLRHNERDHAGIFITGSNEVSLDSIMVYHTAGLGVLSQYSGNLHFRSVHVVPNTSKNRFFSGHDDGCHFSNCKGNILVENCSFRGLMDDPVNVHGTAVQVVEIKSGRELRCRFMHHQSTGMEWAFEGDSISFIDHNTLQSVGIGSVAGFKALNETDFILTLKDNVPGNFHVQDALENLTWTPSVTVRNSLFAVNRARGILISTPGKVLIEGNTFQSSGSAILIAGDANQWFESGAVKDVMIRKNTFTDECLTSMYQFCEAIISIEPEIPTVQADKPFHRNITITENDFHPFDYPVLYAKSTGSISFTNNSITRSHRFKPFHSRKDMFTFVACSKILVAGNKFQGDVLGKHIMLKNTNKKELKAVGIPVVIEKQKL